MVCGSGYQPDDYGNLWIPLIDEACHATSVTSNPSVHLRRRVLATCLWQLAAY
jgi:hypothetical protein